MKAGPQEDWTVAPTKDLKFKFSRVTDTGVELNWKEAEGQQNKPLWHKDYFELNAVEKKQVQEKLPALPFA